ncbi:MAG: PQQ-binding-like beta-propeller repeat protein, partial [Deltaproteobacteria bacterium]|nr:PQQ-binding-like beta-propeller repeat protein [Deltaproteobacteria bacterium]
GQPNLCPQAFEGSPAIGKDGTIFIGDDIAVPNYFFALKPDGNLKWKYETYLVYGQMDASPAIGDDGTIYVGSHGDSGYVGPVGQLVALEPSGGKVLSGFPLSTKQIISSPAISGGVLFAGMTGLKGGAWYPMVNWVFAVNNKGTILWTTELSNTGEGLQGLLGLSSIAVGKEGDIFIAENRGSYADAEPYSLLVELDPDTGKKIWEVQVSSEAIVVGSPVIRNANFGEDVIVGLSDGHLVSANPYSGGAIITFDTEIEKEITSAIAGSPVLGDDGNIYAVANLYMAIDRFILAKVSKEGKILTSKLFEGDLVTSSLAMGNGGVIYFGTNTGKLYAVQSAAKGLDKDAPWPAFRHDRKNTGNSGVKDDYCEAKPEKYLSIGLNMSSSEFNFFGQAVVSFKGISEPGEIPLNRIEHVLFGVQLFRPGRGFLQRHKRTRDDVQSPQIQRPALSGVSRAAGQIHRVLLFPSRRLRDTGRGRREGLSPDQPELARRVLRFHERDHLGRIRAFEILSL